MKHSRLNMWIEGSEMDLYKLLFCCMIAINHLQQFITFTDPILLAFGRSYVFVEFFFIASGYFLYNSWARSEDYRPVIKRKVISLYPHFLFAVVLMIFTEIFVLKSAAPSSIMIPAVLELLGLSAFGISTSLANPVAWYVSVLLIDSIILLLAFHSIPKRFHGIVAGLACILLYTFIYHVGDAGIGYTTNEHMKFFTLGTYRGIAGMCAGVVIWTAKPYVKKIRTKWTIVLRVICYLTIWLLIFEVSNGYLEMYRFHTEMILVLVFAVLVALSTVNTEKVGKLGRVIRPYSYAMYLDHYFLIKILAVYTAGRSFSGLTSRALFIVLVFVFSTITIFVVKKGVQVFCCCKGSVLKTDHADRNNDPE